MVLSFQEEVGADKGLKTLQSNGNSRVVIALEECSHGREIVSSLHSSRAEPNRRARVRKIVVFTSAHARTRVYARTRARVLSGHA